MSLRTVINERPKRDETDDMLLTILQSNAEFSLSDLGSQLGLSKMSISNRIRRLKSSGILEGASYRVNPE